MVEEVDIFKVLGGKGVWRWSGGVRGSDKLQLLIKSKKDFKESGAAGKPKGNHYF